MRFWWGFGGGYRAILSLSLHIEKDKTCFNWRISRSLIIFCHDSIYIEREKKLVAEQCVVNRLNSHRRAYGFLYICKYRKREAVAAGDGFLYI